MKISKKYLLATFLSLSLILLLISPMIIWGQATNDELEKLRKEAGYKAGTDLVVVIGMIINIILGLLGVIAVIFIVLGGFKWMTAGGSDEKIKDAKKMIGQGIVGLVIILAAYAIAKFVMDKLRTPFME